MRKSSEQIQDEIFQEMNADEKLAVGSGLWKLGRELAGNKINYEFDKLTTSARNRSKAPAHQDRKAS